MLCLPLLLPPNTFPPLTTPPVPAPPSVTQTALRAAAQSSMDDLEVPIASLEALDLSWQEALDSGAAGEVEAVVARGSLSPGVWGRLQGLLAGWASGLEAGRTAGRGAGGQRRAGDIGAAASLYHSSGAAAPAWAADRDLLFEQQRRELIARQAFDLFASEGASITHTTPVPLGVGGGGARALGMPPAAAASARVSGGAFPPMAGVTAPRSASHASVGSARWSGVANANSRSFSTGAAGNPRGLSEAAAFAAASATAFAAGPGGPYNPIFSPGGGGLHPAEVPQRPLGPVAEGLAEGYAADDLDTGELSFAPVVQSLRGGRRYFRRAQPGRGTAPGRGSGQGQASTATTSGAGSVGGRPLWVLEAADGSVSAEPSGFDLNEEAAAEGGDGTAGTAPPRAAAASAGPPTESPDEARPLGC